MLLPLILLMVCLLLRAETTMAAASDACRLFVTAVMPGLLPYMTLSMMLVSRVKRLTPGALMLLGWGGGSPTGARLLHICAGLTKREQLRLAISCATMSPMFLLGTLGGWLGSQTAGVICLISVLAGGWLAGRIAAALERKGAPGSVPRQEGSAPLPFGAAVEAAARTMLLVCGTMVMLRVFAALAGEALPAGLRLPVTTLLEVTTGTAEISRLPLPLPLRTALAAGSTGFGGLAIILQNRALYPEGFLSLGRQLLWQALHGAFSFLIALGGMWLVC